MDNTTVNTKHLALIQVKRITPVKTQFGYFDKDFKVVNTIAVDLNSINSSDPLAFAYGVSRGKQAQAQGLPDGKHVHGSPFRELAKEYLRGFLLGYKGFLVPEGTKMRKGQEQNFSLLDKQIDPSTLNKQA